MRDRRAYVLVLGVALALRLNGLDSPAPWVDEANTWIIAREDPMGIFARLSQDSSPPLYYLMLHAWMQLFGESVVALRMLSVVAGMILVALVHHVGRAMSSRRTGLWAAWLIAVSPTQIYYSQQVRMYALLALLALVATFALVRAFERGGFWRWAHYAVSSAMLLLTHNFAFHALTAHAVIGLLAWRHGRTVWPWFVACAFVALLYGPWSPTLWGQLTGEDTYSWFAAQWGETSAWRILLRSFGSLGLVGHFFPESWVTPASWMVVSTVAGLVLVARGVMVERRRQCVVPLWSAALLFAPYVSALVLSWALVPHFVPGRVDQMMIAPFALLTGAGLTAWRMPRVVGGAFALITLAGAIGVRPLDMPSGSESSAQGMDAQLADAIMRRSQQGDVVLCTSLTRAPLEYLVARTGLELKFLSFPRSTAEHLGGQDDEGLLRQPGLLAAEAAAILTTAVGRDFEERRVHVVLVEGDVNRALAAEIDRLEVGGELLAEGDDVRFVQRGTWAAGVLRTFRSVE